MASKKKGWKIVQETKIVKALNMYRKKANIAFVNNRKEEKKLNWNYFLHIHIS